MVSVITGGRRYSFYLEGGSSVFTGCEVDGGRHQFVTGSRVAGPNVFHDCHATNAYNDIGPHHRWATGTLYDGVTGGMLSVENRGAAGSGHGWSGASIVYWNSQAIPEQNLFSVRTARIKVEAAPGTLSWSIGSIGLPDLGSNGRAVWEQYGRAVTPASLYLAQRADTFCAAGLDCDAAASDSSDLNIEPSQEPASTPSAEPDAEQGKTEPWLCKLLDSADTKMIVVLTL